MKFLKLQKKVYFHLAIQFPAVSPTALPNNPFAIGVFTEIFPALISDSLSGTNVNFVLVW